MDGSAGDAGLLPSLRTDIQRALLALLLLRW
jgi:hypothetical protein